MSYAFKPGQKVKFNNFNYYTERKIDPWTWLVIDSIDEKNFATMHVADNPRFSLGAGVEDLQKPIGFEEVYTVIVKDGFEASKVHSWLSTRGGIAVWTCLDLSCAGRTMFAPGTYDGKVTDETMKPHWSYGLVEIVDNPKRIEIQIEETTHTKPKDKGWTWDKHYREWYRRVPWSHNETKT